MKPYYDDGTVRIFHGDCREVLPELAADAVITDPPYGIGREPVSGTRGRQTNTWHPPPEWDRSIDPMWCELVCAAAPVVAWFGRWQKREEVARAMRWPGRAEIVWAKNRHTGPAAPVAPRDERIWLFSEKPIQPQRFETSVWDEPGIPSWQYKHHRNQKPLGLMRRLVTFLVVRGGLALDPFMGSGTTLEAAKLEGRKAIGIEIDERQCEVAARRLGQEILAI